MTTLYNFVMPENDEYEHVLESIRHYSNLRFANLTVFTGSVFAVAYAALGNSVITGKSPSLRIALKFGGIILTTVFGVLELSFGRYMHAFGLRATELKPKTHWALRPHYLRHLSNWALWVFFLAVGAFWVYSFCCDE